MNLKKIIKEEIGDFDWAKSVNNPNRMDTSRDYMGVWPQFEEMLSELDIPYIEGEIDGDDYEGKTWMRIRTLYFEFDVYIRFEYDQTIESGTVYWSIVDPNEDSDGDFEGRHSLVTHDYLKPIVDKLREMAEPLVEKRKHLYWGHLGESFDWVRDALDVDPEDPTTWIGKTFRLANDFRPDVSSDDPNRMLRWTVTGIVPGFQDPKNGYVYIKTTDINDGRVSSSYRYKVSTINDNIVYGNWVWD